MRSICPTHKLPAFEMRREHGLLIDHAAKYVCDMSFTTFHRLQRMFLALCCSSACSHYVNYKRVALARTYVDASDASSCRYLITWGDTLPAVLRVRSTFIAPAQLRRWTTTIHTHTQTAHTATSYKHMSSRSVCGVALTFATLNDLNAQACARL